MGHQKYIWELKSWPLFTYQSEDILLDLGIARRAQGHIIAQANLIGIESEAALITEEAFMTSAIEGEKLDRGSIRSSVARRLGLSTAGLSKEQREIDGLVEMLMSATKDYDQYLSAKMLYAWQAALFPTGYSGLTKIATGRYRNKTEAMQVISTSGGKVKVHFEAPPKDKIQPEMSEFIKWFNSHNKTDGLIKAAIAHFWFITIHPFEDGNGRLARAITDRALAHDEKTGTRLYSLSSQIVKERNEYYDVLESSQKGTVDITKWIKWFLAMYTRAIQSSNSEVDKAVLVAQFWKCHRESLLNPRQLKVVNRLLEAMPNGFEGGMTNRKYVSLTKVSRETAKRDLAELERKKILKRNPGDGRSVSYSIDLSFFK